MNRRLARAANSALALLHRQLVRVSRAVPELALALFDDPALERDALVAHYGEASSYTSSDNQQLGLYPFERRALQIHFPKPPARLLLPGAGAGRELVALREMGYRVDAFDASAALVSAATAALGVGAVELRDVGAFVADVESGRNVTRYDGIFTGWAMWTHLVRHGDRLAALKAFRRVCDDGPLLLSFWRREKIFDLEEEMYEQGSPSRVARALRVLREQLLRHAPLETGSRWDGGTFVHLVSEAELAAEANPSGWTLVHYERDGSRFPNAVLVPRKDAGR